MKHYFLMFIICSLLIAYQTEAQINVTSVSSRSVKPEKNGVFFSLPRKMIKVSVTVKEIENMKGPYAEYAEQLMGISNPIMQNTKEYELVDIKMETLVEPDPEQIFFIEIDDKSSKEEKNFSVNLTSNGIIRSINGISSAKEAQLIKEEYKVITQEDLFSMSVNPSLYHKVDTIIRIVTVDTNTVKKRFFNTYFEEKSTEIKAREAADMVSRIREGRFNLLTGYQETNYSPETMKYMDEKLQLMVQEYISLFKGLKTEMLNTYTFYLIPDPNKLNQVVCKFSKESGISDATDNKGREVILNIRRSGTLTQMPNWASSAVDARSTLIPYRIPEMVRLSVNYLGKIYDEQLIALPQFGIVSRVPFVKSKIEFDPQTGCVVKIYYE
ncbi:MAG TPA: DUF4831 family protein [Bacteroidales bacterium]|jgi:hypothetical protein|nr:DUF4831 family protein [Bacteroidales bacterium]